MPWLKIKEGDTVTAKVNLASVKTVIKHWTGSHSQLCPGPSCPLCLAGLAKRTRYQTQVIVDTVPFMWEFGELTMADLKAISTDNNWAEVTITRLGRAQDTRYQIQAPVRQPPATTKYIGGKYEHLIRR